MKKALRIAAIVLVCFGLGYGIGTIGTKIMKGNENKQAAGCIGPSQVTAEDGRLTPEILLSMGRLSDPQLSPDGKAILYGVSYTSIKDNRSCRNLFLCNTDGSGKVQLTRYAKSVSCARWSPDGSSVYFVQGGQIWNAPLKGKKLGKKVQISDIPTGVGEFSISPDGCNIMFTSTIKNPNVDSPKDICPDLDKAQAYVTSELMYRHWDHWVTETPRTYVSALCNGKVTPETSFDILGIDDPGYELPTEPFGGIEQLAWHPDGRHIAYSCRKLIGKQYAFSTNSCIYVHDFVTGQTVAVTTSGGYDTDPSWSPDGTRLAWISMERDGYEADRQRLMVADVCSAGANIPDATLALTNRSGGDVGSCAADTALALTNRSGCGTDCCEKEGQCFGMKIGPARELTEGFKYDVGGIFWAEDGIVFPATMDGIGALCKASLDGGVERLTPESWWCGFGTPFGTSEDGGLLCTCNSMDFPTELVKVTKDGYTPITKENEHILEQLNPIRCERIELPCANGETLYSWVLYPYGFDESKTWPGIEMFNGGPQSSLDQSWSYRWNFFLMAQQGYVVVLPNRHGDSGFGQPWKEQISGDYQGLNMEDYQIAGRWFKQQKWAGKLAGVGASYGGFSVYNMMGIHGDLYDCFISHAGIFDEKMMWYTTEEAWFGNWDNGGLTEYAYTEGQTGPAGDGITFGGLQQAGAPYAKGDKVKEHYGNDPEAKVTNWHTPLLCMHGMMDFRIPYTQGMAAFAAAQMMGVPSKLVMFPEECHWILQPQNALLWHREFFSWLDEWTR